MEIKKTSETCYKTAVMKGFHDKKVNFAEKIALIHSEISEALEADRSGKVYNKSHHKSLDSMSDEDFKRAFEIMVKDTPPDELADAIIRIFDLSEAMKYDIAWHIKQKMRYNSLRPRKHGSKKY